MTLPITRSGRVALQARLGLQHVLLRAMAVRDPVSKAFLGSPRVDCYRVYEQIRARGPVAASPTRTVSVTSRQLCDSVLRDARFGVRLADGSDRHEADLLSDVATPISGSLLELDPPDHTRLRRVVAPAFRPKLVRGWQGRLEQTVHRVVDRALSRGQVDLIRDVCEPFPIAVISDLLGIPDDQQQRFAQIGALVGQSLNGVTSVRQARALEQATAELGTLFDGVAARRFPHDGGPGDGDDVVSLLARARADGTISSDDLRITCGLLLLAGFETTTNLIGNAVAALQRNPDLWRALVDDPALAEPIIEETLRWDPPVQVTGRVAHKPVKLAGTWVPGGMVVIVWLAAANRDPDVYPDPARFDPHREGAPEHLAFSSGIHYCLGAPLARLEGAIALRVLSQRFPRLEVDLTRSRRRPGATLRGYAAMPTTLKAHRAAVPLDSPAPGGRPAGGSPASR